MYLSTSTTCRPVVDGGGGDYGILIRTATPPSAALLRGPGYLHSVPSTAKPYSSQPAAHYVRRLILRAMLADPWPKDRSTTNWEGKPNPAASKLAKQDGIRCPRKPAGGPRKRQQAVPSKEKNLDAATEPMGGDGSHAMQDKCRSAH